MRRLAGAAALFLLAGCTVGPDFTPPDPEAPPAWVDQAMPSGVSSRSEPDPAWWGVFQDHELTALVARGVAGNLDLKAAVFRIAQSRAGQLSAEAAGLPTVNGTASYNREQLGLKGLLQEKGAGQLSKQFPEAGGLINQLTRPVDLYAMAVDASWEIDLFGRVRRSVEEAGAESAAAEESRNDALVSLEAEVAEAYLQLRGAQSDTAIARENVRVEQQVLDLTTERQKHGLASELDVDDAQAQLAGTEATLPQYEQAAAQAMNRLSLLVGEPPGTLDAELTTPSPLPPTPPEIGIGLPASLARRRPDIRMAEARLHAATAGIGVATAQFYPDLALNGSIGLRATQFKYLGDWANHFYSVGPSLSIPIFEGGKLTANLKLSQAQAGEAAVDFTKAVLGALEEVENALVAYRTDQARRAALAETALVAGRALDLAREQYRKGLVSFITVLTDERTSVQSREQLTEGTVTVATDVVTLYKALGGGWETPPG